MEDERPVFAYEVVPLDAPDVDDRRERLLQAAELLARQVVGGAHDLDEVPPFFVLEDEGGMSAAFWHVLLAVDAEYFREVVLPETLASLDPGSAAFVTAARLPQGDGDPLPVIVIYAIDRSTEEPPGITLAAPVAAEQDSLLLSPFEVLANGLNLEMSRALRRAAP